MAENLHWQGIIFGTIYSEHALLIRIKHSCLSSSLIIAVKFYKRGDTSVAIEAGENIFCEGKNGR